MNMQNPENWLNEDQPLLDAVQQEAPAKKAWHENVPTSTADIVQRGGIFVFGFLGVFFAWALLFPIASAVVANGKIVSAGQNKLIQHPTGGVVQEILVEDGTRVQEGQVLVILDPSGSQAKARGPFPPPPPKNPPPPSVSGR